MLLTTSHTVLPDAPFDTLDILCTALAVIVSVLLNRYTVSRPVAGVFAVLLIAGTAALLWTGPGAVLVTYAAAVGTLSVFVPCVTLAAGVPATDQERYNHAVRVTLISTLGLFAVAVMLGLSVSA